MGPICLSKPSIPWLGIVWNSGKRGKNDGSLTDENGVHVYFQCKPNCGSFVQPSKVQRCKTIAQAIQTKWEKANALTDRYKSDSKSSYCATERIAMKDDDPKAKMIELVGMDEVADYQLHSSIITAELSYQNIVGVGEVNASFQTVETLDLNHNCIQSTDDVYSILQAFPSLQYLILNNNPIHSSLSTFPIRSTLVTLALSSTTLHFNSVIPLIASLPCLRNLYMSNNGMKDEAMQSPNSASLLQTLDLSSNSISQWSVLRNLSSLSSLRSLYVGDNPFKSSLSFSFPHIHSLDISHICIGSFAEMKEILSHFPSLEELEMRGNPWYDSDGQSREVDAM